MLIAIHSENPQLRLIRKAAEVLKNGGLVIYPTDTVYGLGCALFNKRGIERIYEIKKYDRKQPLSFICADLKEISQYAQVSDFAYRTMKRLLPGPYTFILEASRVVPRIILPKRKTVGIRVPNNPICLSLVKELGQPIISSSVKDEKGDFLGDPKKIAELFRQKVELIIDGGLIVPEPSTVISLIADEFTILRAGKGSATAYVPLPRD